jgi:hypothetical protein
MTKRPNVKNIIYWIVFITLFGSMVFAIVMAVNAPYDYPPGQEHVRIKSDYMLMIVQCFLGLMVMMLPGMLEKKLRFEIPNHIFVMYFIFLFCAIYLGEVHNFYNVIPSWDLILHTFSGVMLGALGFSLVIVLNSSERVKVALSPVFMGVFAFCFALAAGVVWEIYEFTLDSILGFNMQKAYASSGEAFIGAEALLDTMTDLIVDAAGALMVSIVGVATMKKRTQEKEHPQ